MKGISDHFSNLKCLFIFTINDLFINGDLYNLNNYACLWIHINDDIIFTINDLFINGDVYNLNNYACFWFYPWFI
jgi:hypothetical protein